MFLLFEGNVAGFLLLDGFLLVFKNGSEIIFISCVLGPDVQHSHSAFKNIGTFICFKVFLHARNFLLAWFVEVLQHLLSVLLNLFELDEFVVLHIRGTVGPHLEERHKVGEDTAGGLEDWVHEAADGQLEAPGEHEDAQNVAPEQQPATADLLARFDQVFQEFDEFVLALGGALFLEQLRVANEFVYNFVFLLLFVVEFEDGLDYLRPVLT